MLEELFYELAQRGYQGRVVSIKHLGDLREAIEGQYQRGLLAEDLYQSYLTDFDFGVAASLSEATSIIVVAVPRPQLTVTFGWIGGSVRLVIPPTYPESETEAHVRDLLAHILEPVGYRVAAASLPKKLLAVRSGLAVYGKNNIAYIPGIGSLHGLVAMSSDVPVQQDGWREPQMMERCRKCSACLNSCPVGAISSERFLIRAERCITFHNEKPSQVPFPATIDPAWHHCLVGCMYCQRACPENKQFVGWVEERAEFSREETALLLEGAAIEQLPPGTAEKLRHSHLVDYLDVLPRNLGVLLDRKTSPG